MALDSRTICSILVMILICKSLVFIFIYISIFRIMWYILRCIFKASFIIKRKWSWTPLKCDTLYSLVLSLSLSISLRGSENESISIIARIINYLVSIQTHILLLMANGKCVKRKGTCTCIRIVAFGVLLRCCYFIELDRREKVNKRNWVAVKAKKNKTAAVEYNKVFGGNVFWHWMGRAADCLSRCMWCGVACMCVGVSERESRWVGTHTNTTKSSGNSGKRFHIFIHTKAPHIHVQSSYTRYSAHNNGNNVLTLSLFTKFSKWKRKFHKSTICSLEPIHKTRTHTEIENEWERYTRTLPRALPA